MTIHVEGATLPAPWEARPVSVSAAADIWKFWEHYDDAARVQATAGGWVCERSSNGAIIWVYNQALPISCWKQYKSVSRALRALETLGGAAV